MKCAVACLIGLMINFIVTAYQVNADEHALTDQTEIVSPPIEQPMVREGDLALKLANALGIGSPVDEIEAETALGNLGISPRNGWIADYPVTPDIIGELQKTVSDAAASGKLSMGIQEALKQLSDVSTGLGIAVAPAGGAKTEAAKSTLAKYPDQTVINNYYSTNGPPIVTYYEPPPDYFYLYSWVPYPFLWFGFWYPGYYILNDFHRVVRVHGGVRFVSNHFHDIRRSRMFRVDPVSRFRGRTYTGIGAYRTRGSISTGVPRSNIRIFNNPHYQFKQGGRSAGHSFQGGQGRAAEGRRRR